MDLRERQQGLDQRDGRPWVAGRASPARGDQGVAVASGSPQTTIPPWSASWGSARRRPRCR